MQLEGQCEGQYEGQCWYAVVTKPRQETIALENLQRQGFDCFLPMAENLARRRKRKTQAAAEPLFPGYIFLQANPNKQSLAPVRSTRGALQLVRFGSRLAVVPDSIIEILKARICEETGLIQVAGDAFKTGDKVRVLDGPLAGLSGVFMEQSKQARAILLMQILGGEKRVEVDSLQLEQAG